MEGIGAGGKLSC